MNKNEITSFFLGLFIGFFILSMYLGEGTSVEFTSLTVAIVAVGIATWTGKISREHNKLSVAPILCSEIGGNRLEMHEDGARRYDFYHILSNKGTGPTIITSCEFYIQKKSCSIQELNFDFRESTFGKGKLYVELKDLNYENIISPNENVLLAKVEVEKPFKQQEFASFQYRYRIQLKYKSLYGEEFEYNSYIFCSNNA